MMPSLGLAEGRDRAENPRRPAPDLARHLKERLESTMNPMSCPPPSAEHLSLSTCDKASLSLSEIGPVSSSANTVHSVPRSTITVLSSYWTVGRCRFWRDDRGASCGDSGASAAGGAERIRSVCFSDPPAWPSYCDMSARNSPRGR